MSRGWRLERTRQMVCSREFVSETWVTVTRRCFRSFSKYLLSL